MRMLSLGYLILYCYPSSRGCRASRGGTSRSLLNEIRQRLPVAFMPSISVSYVTVIYSLKGELDNMSIAGMIGIRAKGVFMRLQSA